MTSANRSHFAEAGSSDDAGRPPRLVLVLGECLVDLAPSSPVPNGGTMVGPEEGPGQTVDAAPALAPVRQHLVALPGGGPANIAVGLARLDVPCAFAGRFSRGGFGPWLRKNLLENGVDLNFSVEADEAATIALVTLDTSGRASYTFYGPTTVDWQWTESELPDLSREHSSGSAVKAVHTGSLALAFPPGASVITTWLTRLRQESQVLISFDPNVRPGLVGDLPSYQERLNTVIRAAHIVKASTEDVEAVYPGTAPRSAAEQWLSLGAPLVVITEGPDGATAYHQSGATSHCSPPPIKLADTIGAGDAFTSGLLAFFNEHGLLSPGSIVELDEAELGSSLAQAVWASALTCSRLGADPPNLLELARFVEQNP